MPDPWQSMLVDGNRQIWLLGTQTGEVWYDSGASPQPFAPIPGAVFRYGVSSPWAASLAGPNVVWSSRNQEGEGLIVAARGYTPAAIGTYAVSKRMSDYQRAGSIDDAEAWSYQQEGHTFVNFSFPKANATWTMDVERPTWHERGKWNPGLNRYDIWSPRVHCYAFGKHLVGDRSTGKIAIMDVAYSSEVDESAIRRLRIAPGLNKEHARLPYDVFELLIEPGLGLVAGQGENPLVMLRTSDDGGKTWGAQRQASAGRMGQYKKRVYWTRLGTSSARCFEVTVSDPIPWRIVDAYLNNFE
jgi:hypothetical protein